MSMLLYVLSIVQFMIHIIVLFYENKQRSLSIFLWITLFIMYSIPDIYYTFFIEHNLYAESTYIEANVYVILFCMIYMVTRIIINRSKKSIFLDLITLSKQLRYKFINDKKMRYFFYISLIFIVLFNTLKIYFIISQGYVSNMNWGIARSLLENATGYWQIGDRLYIAIQNYAMIFILLTLLLKKYLITFIVLLSTLFIFATSFNRAAMLPMICVFIVLFYYTGNKMYDWKKIFYGMIVTIIGIFIIYQLRVMRHIGSIADIYAYFLNPNVSIFSRTLQYIFTGDGELTLSKAYYFFISQNNEFKHFGRFYTYIRLILLPIPMELSMGLKPQDFAIDMYSAWYGVLDNTTGTMHPTLYGDCYANVGFLFPLLAVFWSIFVTKIDKFLIKKGYFFKITLLVLISSMYILIARGAIYNACFNAFYGIVSSYVIFSFITRLANCVVSLTRFPKHNNLDLKNNE